MALSATDKKLLDSCLHGMPDAWENFVDRFLGLVVHVVNFTAESRSIRITSADRDDLVAEVFVALLENDMAALRHFRRESSLATYLTVIARRVVVRRLLDRHAPVSLSEIVEHASSDTASSGTGRHTMVDAAHGHAPAGQRDARLDQLLDRDQLEQMLTQLDESEAKIVRMFHLEGKSYQEISRALDMPANSIGPTLTRARAKMRDLTGIEDLR